MDYDRIRRMVDVALQHESRTGMCADAVRKFAQMMGRRIGEQDVQGTVDLIKAYVSHAPAILEEAGKKAKAAGLAAQIAPVLQAAEQYFLQPLDLIPDHLGLVGLMDDAYLAHCMLQGVSDGYRSRTGKPLFATDMTPLNRVVRVLIGEPQASLLDGAVTSVLQGPAIRQSIEVLGNLGGRVPFNVPDPIYGNASIDDIVKVRMGMLGIT